MEHIKEVLFDLIMSILLVEAANPLKIVESIDSLDHFFVLFHSPIETGIT